MPYFFIDQLLASFAHSFKEFAENIQQASKTSLASSNYLVLAKVRTCNCSLSIKY